MSPEFISPRELREVVAQSDRPVLVDFSIPWCASCQKIQPILRDVQRQCRGAVEVFRVDADRDPEVGWRHRIWIAPTVLIFRDGREVCRLERPQSREEILRAIQVAAALKMPAAKS